MTRTILATALLAGTAALLAPALTANAQNLAAANLAAAAPSSGEVAKPRPGYVVFFDRGTTELSSTANDTVRRAADASRSKKAPVIRIVGRADLAEAVKAALVLQGVRPTSIALVGRDDTSPVVRASTGTVEPASRSVLIAF